jgi:hypothetical protein
MAFSKKKVSKKKSEDITDPGLGNADDLRGASTELVKVLAELDKAKAVLVETNEKLAKAKELERLQASEVRQLSDGTCEVKVPKVGFVQLSEAQAKGLAALIRA